jgi:hypothetical protein
MGVHTFKRGWTALLILGLFALAVGISFIWEGPRAVYIHAVVICLDCIGLI